MSTSKSRFEFADTVKGKEIRQKLQDMLDDGRYNTKPSYSSNGELYPKNEMSFVDKHMTYLISHPLLNPDHYVSNVKLLTKVQSYSKS